MESTFVQILCGLLRINLVNWKVTRRFVQYQLPAYFTPAWKGHEDMQHLVHRISSFLHILSTTQCFEELVEIVIWMLAQGQTHISVCWYACHMMYPSIKFDLFMMGCHPILQLHHRIWNQIMFKSVFFNLLVVRCHFEQCYLLIFKSVSLIIALCLSASKPNSFLMKSECRIENSM